MRDVRMSPGERNMHIIFTSMTGEWIATIPLAADRLGYLYPATEVAHLPTSSDGSTLIDDVEVALFGYQDGGVDTDTIDNFDTGEPYIRWTIEGSRPENDSDSLVITEA
jgi:hypothetical protein